MKSKIMISEYIAIELNQSANIHWDGIPHRFNFFFFRAKRKIELFSFDNLWKKKKKKKKP